MPCDLTPGGLDVVELEIPGSTADEDVLAIRAPVEAVPHMRVELEMLGIPERSEVGARGRAEGFSTAGIIVVGVVKM